MIEKIITSSRVNEVSGTASRCISAYKSTSLSSDANLESQVTSLETENAALIVAINRSKAESELDEKDNTRDDKVRAIYYLLFGFLHHPDTSLKQAAEKVLKVFDKYGVEITQESYVSESSLIMSLLTDLAKASLQESIAAISGLSEIIAELQAAQTDFEQTRVAYEAEKAEESTHENATTLKKKVLGIINNKIVVYMRAMALVNEAAYGAFARTIATIIAENNEVVKKRKKKPEAIPEL